MSKELWIEAESKFIDLFIQTHHRAPTADEMEKGMKEFYADYIGGLIDHAQDYLQER